MNKYYASGNLTRDPELKVLPSGMSVCELGIAVNNRVKKGNEWVDAPVFLDLVAWEKRAEWAAQALKKGDPVIFSGEIRQETWEDKATGQKRSKIKVSVEDISKVERFKTAAGGAGATASRAPSTPPPADPLPPSGVIPDEADLPF